MMEIVFPAMLGNLMELLQKQETSINAGMEFGFEHWQILDFLEM